MCVHMLKVAVCMGVYKLKVAVCVGEHMPWCACGGPRSPFSVVPQVTVLEAAVDFCTVQCRLAGPQVMGSILALPPILPQELLDHSCHTLTSVALGIQTQVLKLLWQDLYSLNCLSQRFFLIDGKVVRIYVVPSDILIHIFVI